MSERNNLKILFIPRWFPNRVNPLNGIFIQRHAIAVAKKHEVAVLYVNADPTMKNKTYDSEYSKEDGIVTVRAYYNNSFPEIPIISSFVKFYRYLQSCRRGVKLINEKFGKPDISHIHVLSRTFFIAFYYSAFHKIPFLISEQWSGYFPEDGAYKGFFKKLLTRIAIKQASAVTAVSESLKKAMLVHGLKNNYFIIPNIVNTQMFFPSFQEQKKNKITFIHVSNLDDRAKNISGMINAVKKLSAIRNDFEFHIVGDGPERNRFEEISRTNNLLNSIVFFHGWKKLSEVAEMMRKADLFILFSNYETISCVMLESLASGVPVIGSSIPALKEYVKEGMGLLVPPRDENALCDAMLKAMDNIGSFDKKKMHDYAKDNFSYESVAEKIDTVYQYILKK
ncbi:MAG: glycosyltransferase family 4 protein [Bacteroidetes bacterium]|nr:glycosyltransferase family 4 protein [Bacteroidota bacterium]